MLTDFHVDTLWLVAKHKAWDSSLGTVPHSITTKADADTAIFACYIPDSWHDQGIGVQILTKQAEWAKRQGLSIALEGWRSVYKSWVEKYRPKYVTLVHNYTNHLCESATNIDGSGLSFDGQKAVKWLQAQDILVDISHASEQACWDVLKVATKPVIASHSGVAELTPHPRNLSTNLIKEIVLHGGTIHVPLVKNFVKDLSTFQKHVAFIRAIKGVDVCIGSDRDGAILIDDYQKALRACTGAQQ